jgi:DNA-binding protein HU-beta
MNKAELITEIAAKADINKSKAAKALDTLIDTISAALRANDKVTLVGFGTFSVVTRGARTGRNPRDGAKIKIAEKKVAKFKPGKKLADGVNAKGGKKKK